jgi:hypothetical protein
MTEALVIMVVVWLGACTWYLGRIASNTDAIRKMMARELLKQHQDYS